MIRKRQAQCRGECCYVGHLLSMSVRVGVWEARVGRDLEDRERKSGQLGHARLSFLISLPSLSPSLPQYLPFLVPSLNISIHSSLPSLVASLNILLNPLLSPFSLDYSLPFIHLYCQLFLFTPTNIFFSPSLSEFTFQTSSIYFFLLSILSIRRS